MVLIHVTCYFSFPVNQGQRLVWSTCPSPETCASEAEVGGRAAAGGRAAWSAEIKRHRRCPGYPAVHPQVSLLWCTWLWGCACCNSLTLHRVVFLQVGGKRQEGHSGFYPEKQGDQHSAGATQQWTAAAAEGTQGISNRFPFRIEFAGRKTCVYFSLSPVATPQHTAKVRSGQSWRRI